MVGRYLPFLSLSLLLFLPSCASFSETYESKAKPVEIKKEEVVTQEDKEEIKETRKLGDIKLKVLIFKARYGMTVTSNKLIKIKGHEQIPSSKKCVIKYRDGDIHINGYSFGSSKVELVSAGLLSIKGKKFRGSFIVQKTGSKMYLINKISLEKYLYGVLPSEVSPSWHEELLKAQ